MTQANDLGQIANQARTLYRGRVNTGFQAVATFHDGSSAPSPTYPNMLWFDTGTGTVKQRNPSNTSWNTLGTIGPPLTWTNVDVPPNELTTGDIKLTLKTVADSGWVMMNDTSIGDASSNATSRPPPIASRCSRCCGPTSSTPGHRRRIAPALRSAVVLRRRPTGRRIAGWCCRARSAGRCRSPAPARG